jgi:D-glucosaminate-6-phosphate ammonia-lyase
MLMRDATTPPTAAERPITRSQTMPATMDAPHQRRLAAVHTSLSAPVSGASTEVAVAETSFELLGVAPLINAQGHITTLGGSLMPAAVVEAMANASRSFVQLNDLHQKAGAHIARLVGAPAAFVCNGAASGMFLSGVAVLAGSDPTNIRALPDTGGRPNEFVTSQVEGWHETIGQGFSLAGGKLVKVGTLTENPTVEEYTEAITPKTAALVFFMGTQALQDLSAVVKAAHARGVPVIVDCAAQLPPRSNLTAVLATGGAPVSLGRSAVGGDPLW